MCIIISGDGFTHPVRTTHTNQRLGSETAHTQHAFWILCRVYIYSFFPMRNVDIHFVLYGASSVPAAWGLIEGLRICLRTSTTCTACNILFMTGVCLPYGYKTLMCFCPNYYRSTSKVTVLGLLVISGSVGIAMLVWIAWCSSRAEKYSMGVCMLISIILNVFDIVLLMKALMENEDNASNFQEVEIAVVSDHNPKRKRDDCRKSALYVLAKKHTHDPDSDRCIGDPPARELSDCAVCLEATDTSVIVCNHPMCTECCSDYIYHQFADKPFFTCPVCRRQYDLPFDHS